MVEIRVKIENIVQSCCKFGRNKKNQIMFKVAANLVEVKKRSNIVQSYYRAQWHKSAANLVEIINHGSGKIICRGAKPPSEVA